MSRSLSRRRFLSTLLWAATFLGFDLSGPAEALAQGFLGAASTTKNDDARSTGALTLVNTSTSSIAAGFTSPMFGWVFKKGDIPSGQAPRITVGNIKGKPQAFSWGMQSYWSDDSLKFASFFFISSVGIGPAASQQYQISGGGSVPASSGRALAEVYAQNIKVHATMASQLTGTPNLSGEAGTWIAFVNGDANQKGAYVTHDGQAGKAWRIETEFALQPGGAKHGRLYCYHYVQAFGAGASPTGFRYLPDICQPWYDDPIGAPAKQIRAFTSVTWSINGGQATSFPFPFTGATIPAPFDWDSSVDRFVTRSPNNLEVNTRNHIGGFVGVPCLFGGSGTLPAGAGLTKSDLFWIGSNTTDPNFTTSTFLVANTPNGLASGKTLSATSGASPAFGVTLQPIMAVGTFDHLVGANTEGKYWYFSPRATSPKADVAVRHQIDPPYWSETKLIPPYDGSARTGLAAMNAGTGFPAGYYSSGNGGGKTWWLQKNWNPYYVGNQILDNGVGGLWPSIGSIPAWFVYDWFMQDAIGESIIRTVGLSEAHQRACIKDNQSPKKTILNARNSRYEGMDRSGDVNPVAKTVWVAQQDQPMVLGTYTGPPDSDLCTIFRSISNPVSAHRCARSYYPYLRTGEPQFLDWLMEVANYNILEYGSVQGFSTGFRIDRNAFISQNSTTYYAVPCGPQSYRCSAWTIRDLATCAAVVPQTMPDGSATNQYIKDLMAGACAWLRATVDTGALDAMTVTPSNHYCKSNGFLPLLAGDSSVVAANPSWMSSAGYMAGAMCFAYGAAENQDAKAILQYFATWNIHSLNVHGGYLAFGTYEPLVFLRSFSDQNYGTQVIAADDQGGFSSGDANNGDAWQSGGFPSGKHFRFINRDTRRDAGIAANGDTLYFTRFLNPGGIGIPRGCVEARKYQRVGVTQVSRTQWDYDLHDTTDIANPNSIVIPTDSNPGATFFVNHMTNPPQPGYAGSTRNVEYTQAAAAYNKWMKALAITPDLTRVINDCDQRVADALSSNNLIYTAQNGLDPDNGNTQGHRFMYLYRSTL